MKPVIPFLVGAIILLIVLFIIEQVVPAHYAVKTILKIIGFLAIPAYFTLKSGRRHVLVPSKGEVKRGIIVGAVCFFGLFLLAQIFLPWIDTQIILDTLAESNITLSNFLFVGLYISFCNSFLEEYFFRGLLYLRLKEAVHPITAASISSLLFSLYHIGIFATWFAWWVLLLAIVGLFLFGMIFCWLDKKSIIPSWIAHISANVAIIIIGLQFF